MIRPTIIKVSGLVLIVPKILPLNEAIRPKIITESIDKDAKVIFGTIRDEKLKKGELKVTVIATNFPADMPRKNLFSATGAGQTLVKDENPTVIKKEIHNSIQNGNMGNNDFIKKMDKKETKDLKEEIIIEDNNDDWSAVPAFLRRKK